MTFSCCSNAVFGADQNLYHLKIKTTVHFLILFPFATVGSSSTTITSGLGSCPVVCDPLPLPLPSVLLLTGSTAAGGLDDDTDTLEALAFLLPTEIANNNNKSWTSFSLTNLIYFVCYLLEVEGALSPKSK